MRGQNILAIQSKQEAYQIVSSSEASGFEDGKNQKNNSRVSSGDAEIGSRPAYDSPMSKSTSGIPVPLTTNSRRMFRAKTLGCLRVLLTLSGLCHVRRLSFVKFLGIVVKGKILLHDPWLHLLRSSEDISRCEDDICQKTSSYEGTQERRHIDGQ